MTHSAHLTHRDMPFPRTEPTGYRIGRASLRHRRRLNGAKAAAMRIEYTCEDGSKTIAMWPSLALMYWLGRSYPSPHIENPEPFKIYVSPSPVPSDTDAMFLTLVYAEIERRWNRTPPFEVIPASPKLKHGGKKYQARCLEILRWLHAEGDVATLEVAEKA
jgi:hypothetical protein